MEQPIIFILIKGPVLSISVDFLSYSMDDNRMKAGLRIYVTVRQPGDIDLNAAYGDHTDTRLFAVNTTASGIQRGNWR
jgi:hypothetical protein